MPTASWSCILLANVMFIPLANAFRSPSSKSSLRGPIPPAAESTTPLSPTYTIKSQASWSWIRQRDGDTPIPNAIVSAFQSASWIWTSEVGAPNLAPVADRAFRKTFTTPSGKNASSAVVLITADNAYVLYVNGQLIASVSTPDIPSTPQMAGINGWQIAHAYSVALTPQSNLFAVRGTNFPNPTGGESAAGLRAAIQINYSDGTTTTVQTDVSWLSIKDIPADFQSPALDDSQWTTASVIATANQAPWQAGVNVPSVVPALPSSTTSLNPSSTTTSTSGSTTTPNQLGPSNSNSTPKNSTPIGAVVGGVVAGVFVIGVLVFLFLCRKKILKRNASSSGLHVIESHSMETLPGLLTIEPFTGHALLRHASDTPYHTPDPFASSSVLLPTPAEDSSLGLDVHPNDPLATHASGTGTTNADGAPTSRNILRYRMQRLQDLVLELNREIAQDGADGARITELRARIAELTRQDSEGVSGSSSGGSFSGAGTDDGGGRGGGYPDSQYPQYDSEYLRSSDIGIAPPAYEKGHERRERHVVNPLQ